MTHISNEYKNFNEKFILKGGQYNIDNYYSNSEYHNNEIYKVNGNRFALYGFGELLAVATLLYDFRCIGNAGNNVRYIVQKENGEDED